jgi:hypothetical protein
MSRPQKDTRDSRLHYFVFSFVLILAMGCVSSPYFALPSVAAEGASQTLAVEVCHTHDSPNPIASLYPNNATGTLNGTVALIPISLELARSIIPPQYRILEHAYRALLPSFPEGMYPAVLQALHDHEVQAMGFKLSDFSVSDLPPDSTELELISRQRTGIEFPFLDLLGDNSTSFKWAPAMLMTADNAIALTGAQAYGTTVFPATFDPPCDAYRSVPGAADPSTSSFSGSAVDASVETVFSQTMDETFPLEFFKNVTNQITFADGKSCDNMIRLFNTNVTTGIESVRGSVKARIAPFEGEMAWSDVYGIRFDSAFVENNYLPCENFRGYAGREL